MLARKRLEIVGISKTYPGCKANDSVELSINPGEIHALLGENGAGKSTLMKILYGVIRPDNGEIFFDGKRVEIASPADARSLGIGMVFQHFSLFETLTVAENIVLALGEQAGDRSTLSARITEVSTAYGIPVNPDQPVANLSTGERQRAEIVRCLLQDIRLLILDEPTSVLTPQEVDTLFVTLKTLAAKGCSILFISHKLDEVKALCSSATILRGGKVTGHCQPQSMDAQAIAGLMVGEAHQPAATHRVLTNQPCVEVNNLTTDPLSGFDVPLDAVSFTMNAGEILGVAGVAGNGQEALLMALAGEMPQNTASIRLNNQVMDPLGPVARRRLGLAYVPADRLDRAAVAEKSLADNTLLTAFDQGLLKGGLISRQAVTGLTKRILEKYRVKSSGPSAVAKSLSGGNLQKFVLGREIEQQPRVLVAAHPTWGVDVGAQRIIHDALFALRDQGCAIIIISEDLDELFHISDRLAALCHGQLSPVLPTESLTRARVGCWMAGDFDVGETPLTDVRGEMQPC